MEPIITQILNNIVSIEHNDENESDPMKPVFTEVLNKVVYECDVMSVRITSKRKRLPSNTELTGKEAILCYLQNLLESCSVPSVNSEDCSVAVSYPSWSLKTCVSYIEKKKEETAVLGDQVVMDEFEESINEILMEKISLMLVNAKKMPTKNTDGSLFAG